MNFRLRAAVTAAVIALCTPAARAVGVPPSLTALPPALRTAGFDTIDVAILPSDTVVAPGGTFDVHFAVTQPGIGFNAYDAVIAYDPAALTLLPQPAGWQQGSLMTGACGNTFHRFTAAGDSVVINHSLLCAGVSLHGPGILYNLRFRASNTGQTTHLVLRFIQFYDDGQDRGPVRIKFNTVHVGPPTDGPAPARQRFLQLDIAPNPFNPQAGIRAEFPTAGRQSLVVFDSAGRCVRTLFEGTGTAGVRMFLWDGRTNAGVAAPAGVYFVRASTPHETMAARTVMVK